MNVDGEEDVELHRCGRNPGRIEGHAEWYARMDADVDTLLKQMLVGARRQ